MWRFLGLNGKLWWLILSPLFFWFFYDFEGSEGIKFGEKCEKIEPGVPWNANKNWAGWAGLARWAAQVAIVGPMGAHLGGAIALGLQMTLFDPHSGGRAGATYARFFLLLEDWRIGCGLYTP